MAAPLSWRQLVLTTSALIVIATAAAQEGPQTALQPIPLPPNYILGTQEIYGPGHYLYNYSALPMLEEQRNAAVELGTNQMKMVLSSTKTCGAYAMDCDGSVVVDLASLSAQPLLARTFGDPRIRWFHFWLESFANPQWSKSDWTEAELAAEYAETKAWAIYMLKTYSGSGKTFMAGNWEGDWILLGASGCNKPGGGKNLTCDPTPAVIQRMVQWGQTRQRAIDDARAHAAASGVTNVTMLYYIEMNLGPEALPPGSPGCPSNSHGGPPMCTEKPGVTNSVLRDVNPDLVSYRFVPLTSTPFLV
jgi:hypothetical protein